MTDYTMKPINGDTPRDREIVLGYADYATQWLGRWDEAAGEFLPRCRPDNGAAETTWERADSWCHLPKWSANHG